MAKRSNDSDDEEDRLRELLQDDNDQTSGDDVKPIKAVPKKKIQPNKDGGDKKKARKEKENAKPAPKKARTSGEGSSKKGADVEVETDNDGEAYIELGGSKRISVREYKGKTLVDIREYYNDKATDTMKPGKKGISLNSEQFAKLVQSIGVLERLI